MSNHDLISSLAVVVSKKKAEETRKWLVAHDFLRLDLRIKVQDDLVFLPIKGSLASNIKGHRVTQMLFEIQPQKIKLHELILHTLSLEDLPSTSFYSLDSVGDIAILKIDPEYLPKANIIAKIIKQYSSYKHVFLKLGAVTGVFRLPQLSLLAGDKKTEYTTIHREHGLKIFVDVTKTYFNPRLGTEHNRISSLVRANEKVVDLFTGVGSFALHIAKNIPATVYAVDINPRAIECLYRSIALNKKRLKGNIIPICGDARNQNFSDIDRLIMNLPESAFSFLRSSIKYLADSATIYLYHFDKDQRDKQSHFIKIIEEEGYNVSIIKCRILRDVAPYVHQIVIEATISKI